MSDYSDLAGIISKQYGQEEDPFYQIGASVLKKASPELDPNGNRSFWGGFLPAATQGFLGGTALGYGRKNALSNRQTLSNKLSDAPALGSPEFAQYVKGDDELSKLPELGLLNQSKIAEIGEESRGLEKALLVKKAEQLGQFGDVEFVKDANGRIVDVKERADPAAIAVAAGDAEKEVTVRALAKQLGSKRAAEVEYGRLQREKAKKDDPFVNGLLTADQKNSISGTTSALLLGDRLNTDLNALPDSGVLETQLKKRYGPSELAQVMNRLQAFSRLQAKAIEGGRLTDQDAAVYTKLGQGDAFVDISDVKRIFKNSIGDIITSSRGPLTTVSTLLGEEPDSFKRMNEFYDNIDKKINGSSGYQVGQVGQGGHRIVSVVKIK